MRFAVIFLFVPMSVAICTGCSNSGRGSRTELTSIARIYEQGDPGKAAEKLQSYLKTYPQDDLAWTILGNARENLDQDQEAEAAYSKALEINSRQFQAITGMGILSRKKRDYDRALGYYKQAIAIDPKYAQAYASMVVISLKQKNYPEALTYAQQAYDLDRKDPGVVANLATACHFNGMTARRDQLTQDAERLGYKNGDKLRQIYSGEMTLED